MNNSEKSALFIGICIGIMIIIPFIIFILSDSSERKCMTGAEKVQGYLTSEMYSWCKESF